MLDITDAQLLRALSLRSRVAVKRELQKLIRAHAAASAFLWTASAKGDRTASIEYAGDTSTLPRWSDLGGPVSFGCEQRTLPCADGDQREVVLVYVRICLGAPTLVVGLVDSRAPLAGILADDIEGTAERIESLIVDVLDPAPSEKCTSPTREPRSARPGR